MKKHFATKFKNKSMKLVCIVKFIKFLVKLDKLLHKLDKLLLNLKFNMRKKTMDFLHAKSNMRITTLHVKGVIITIANNTMKSNATTS